ncbi:MAG TPA: efflux RND transporter periplasmic adaptor subunit [Verrucomicrobiae bacterium]|jgi:cobalt-zinc-cadmium efflux system membrane fusion protein|nr:efflux RND transporter periplasmic adaptor subunit [Verrucomicrobiae bacterium]
MNFKSGFCISIFPAALVFASLAGCSSGGSESKMASFSSSETKEETADLFTVPQDQLAHVQVVAVEKSALPRTLRLTGAVAYNAFKTTPVFAAIGGPVREILVTPGESVHAGQPLLTVNSPDYSAARSAYLKARSAFLLADKFYTRAQDLLTHGAIAEADFQTAESTRIQAQADLQASEDALRVLGITDVESLEKNAPKTTSQVPVLAPVGGEVVERLVGPGQLLQAGTTQVFTISDMSTVWVLVNVYQGDVAYVRSGDSVNISTDSYPDTFHGRISYIAPALDPNTRTLQARIVTENPGDKLKKDMYVTATVSAGAIANALTVPDAAVLRDSENQPFVYVQSSTKQNEFARRLVQLGDSHGGRSQITSGVKEGERVVGDGSLFLQFKNSLEH